MESISKLRKSTSSQVEARDQGKVVRFLHLGKCLLEDWFLVAEAQVAVLMVPDIHQNNITTLLLFLGYNLLQIL